MSRKAKLLMQVIGLSTALISGVSMAADSKNAETDKGFVLFKIHDIVPEKNANGKVLYCNVGATFFNRTKEDVSNAALTLSWNDDVIGDAIDQEERADKEKRRVDPKAPRPRYSTAGFTGKVVNTSLKLPPLKVGQQVSLKTKVDTDRCFLLLNDMDVTVNNCGTAGMSERRSRSSGCDNLFSYVSPKMPEYYTEFKETSYDDQIQMENDEVDSLYSGINATFDEAIKVIRDITVEIPKEEEEE
jgi:hypothetical protein